LIVLSFALRDQVRPRQRRRRFSARRCADYALTLVVLLVTVLTCASVYRWCAIIPVCGAVKCSARSLI
jgi:hypothetical protein